MKILAVDDEPDTRKLLKDLLEHAGHRVTAAADAIEALLHLRLQRFDLLLLDLMMPGIEGFKLARMVGARGDTSETPILVVSCRRDEEAKEEARRAGCIGYLEKPFSPMGLLSAVSAVKAPKARKIPQ